jgi:hypothetical protein
MLPKKKGATTEINPTPGIIGPICSESTIGPRAQSLLTGSQETETKQLMSSTKSTYDAVVAPRISI